VTGFVRLYHVPRDGSVTGRVHLHDSETKEPLCGKPAASAARGPNYGEKPCGRCVQALRRRLAHVERRLKQTRDPGHKRSLGEQRKALKDTLIDFTGSL